MLKKFIPTATQFSRCLCLCLCVWRPLVPYICVHTTRRRKVVVPFVSNDGPFLAYNYIANNYQLSFGLKFQFSIELCFSNEGAQLCYNSAPILFLYNHSSFTIRDFAADVSYFVPIEAVFSAEAGNLLRRLYYTECIQYRYKRLGRFYGRSVLETYGCAQPGIFGLQ